MQTRVNKHKLFEQLLESVDFKSEGHNSLNEANRPNRPKTGFRALDKSIGSLYPGELIVIGSRPSLGKSTLAMNIAEHIMHSLHSPVIIFSNAVSLDNYLDRHLARISHVDQVKIRTGYLDKEERQRIDKSLKLLISRQNLFLEENSNLTIDDIERTISEAHILHNDLSLIIIDELQGIEHSANGQSGSQSSEIEIYDKLSTLAKSISIPMIVVTQISSEFDFTEDYRPTLIDLPYRDTPGDIADTILFVYRDEVYNENSPSPGIAEIIIAKHRQSVIGKVNLRFNGPCASFEDCE